MTCNCNNDSCKIENDGETLVFDIDSDICLKLNRLLFEFNGLFELACAFSSDTQFKPDKERYDEIINQYLNSYAEYNMLINACAHDRLVANGYEPKKCKINNLQINFFTETIIIDLKVIE